MNFRKNKGDNTMGILDSKKELAAMQEEIKQLQADVDRIKSLVLAIAKQVPAPKDPQPLQDYISSGPVTFIYEPGDSDLINKVMK